MRVAPGDVVATRQGWSISKYNRTMAALGGEMGNNLLVVAVRGDDLTDDEACVACLLSPRFGPTWVNLDDRTNYIVK